ncbi:alpha/beta hydrolase [Paractinoplanes ferrugineus]|uniref:Alpha/beta hydrolase n=1 Tax=Paractinoplanes ferrugineus TaxID=113564 RepID=A0A919J9I2_9ACTN|nr:alpha/beta hydrolase [Actinoplanes ferrugineus]
MTVPGAQLYTERAGVGVPLLLISGGGGDAGMYEEVVPLLARHYTVFTYDRRGNSRSRFTDPQAAIGVAVQANDAVAVLDHHGVKKAYVFGGSSGAIIALDLLAHHPDRLSGVVAHEPPLVSILPDDSPERRALAEIARIAREKSPLRAYAAFGAMTMNDPPWLFRSAVGQALVAAASRAALPAGAALRRVTGRKPSSMTRQLGNADLLLRRELPLISLDYQPDLPALREVAVPWRPATGRDSVGKPYYRPAHLLAERLGVPCEEFPGGHTVYIQQPDQFTEALTNILEGFPG